MKPHHKKDASLLRKSVPDYLLLCIYIAFVAMSILLVYSNSVPFSQREMGTAYGLFRRHIVSILISFVALVIGFRIPIRIFRRYNAVIALLVLVLLFSPFIPSLGVEIGGTKRWISLFGAQFQPSEVIRILVIFYLAHQLSRWAEQMKSPSLNTEKTIIILYLSVVGIMILLQKDFSTTVLYFLTVFAMLFMIRMPLKFLIGLVISGFLFLLPFVLFAPYRLQRINMLLNLRENPENAYQIYQALNAFHRGGMVGVGPGDGKHNIPYIFNDFIYAASAEEMGFIGAFLILCLFFFLLLRGFRIATMYMRENIYAFLLAFGFTFSIVVQAIMNIAVNMVLIFPTGIALPFLSYGGTSFIMSSFAMGILLQLSQKKDFLL